MKRKINIFRLLIVINTMLVIVSLVFIGMIYFITPTNNVTIENKVDTTSPQQSSTVTVEDKTSNATETNTQMNEERVVNIDTTEAFKIIVNKKHPLAADYDPGENPIAKDAFIKLINKMQELGYPISDSYSGYRSYELQKITYQSLVNAYGQTEADTSSARPGFSEHQTGLVFDIKDTDGKLLGEGKLDGGAIDWLANNAHKYGFVVRYLKGKEAITGYIYEPWHIRFIGNDASKVYQSGLTLEEYYGVEGGDYN